MIKYFIVALIFFFKSALSLELGCLFEEVYKNGETQQGYLLVKKEKFRYQYISKNLYTIIKNQNIFYLIDNKNLENFSIIKKTDLIFAIAKTINDYPNIRNIYKEKDYILNIEKNEEAKFISRISVLSKNHNMSIYFYDCMEKPINDKYFSYSPVFQYNQ